MILREEYYLDGINCHPSTFETESEELNEKWKKNQDYNEIKSHHYIISFDPQDAIDRGLTGGTGAVTWHGISFLRNIIFHSKSAGAGSAISIRNAPNTLSEECSAHITKQIIF